MAGNYSQFKEDRISELPQNIQETILGFLPIKDAVRTSILSTKWRHCWTTIPHLIFDHQTVHSMVDKFDKCYNPKLMAYNLVSIINKALLLHNGQIDTFSFTFSLDDADGQVLCSGQVIHDYIDQWIPLFIRKGIKKLTLKESSSYLRESNAHHFSSLDLTHLSLTRIWFPYTPAFGRFPYLTILELVDATNTFGKNIFDCPVLEKLTLIICEGLFPNNFCAPNLKCLHQIYCSITSEYSLAGLENLEKYSLLLLNYPREETQTFNVVIVPGRLHKIKKLSLAMNAFKYLAAGGSPNRLAKPLTCLKTLSISCINFKDLSQLSCLLCLIRSAPNLCELYFCELYISDDESEEDKEAGGGGKLKNYWIEDPEDCNIDHLEKVTFSYFKGLNTELELVKFLLAHSPSLKTMFIHRSERIKGDAALIMAEEMLQYSRASSGVQIIHLKHPNETDDFDQELWDMYDEISGYYGLDQ